MRQRIIWIINNFFFWEFSNILRTGISKTSPNGSFLRCTKLQFSEFDQKY